MFVIVSYFHSYQVILTNIVSIISFINFLICSLEPRKFSFKQQFFLVHQKVKLIKSLLYLYLILFSIFIYVTFVLFFELKL